MAKRKSIKRNNCQIIIIDKPALIIEIKYGSASFSFIMKMTIIAADKINATKLGTVTSYEKL